MQNDNRVTVKTPHGELRKRELSTPLSYVRHRLRHCMKLYHCIKEYVEKNQYREPCEMFGLESSSE